MVVDKVELVHEGLGSIRDLYCQDQAGYKALFRLCQND